MEKKRITIGSHLEKLCLIKNGVGRDNISDFTTNLIKHYLLKYTESFAKKYIDHKYLHERIVERVEFNYKTQTWCSKKFNLPIFSDDYIILTPKDILTKDDTWINKTDMINKFDDVINSIPNDQLRGQLNNYFCRILPDSPKERERNEAIIKTIQRYPGYIDFYIKLKEETGDEAIKLSANKVREVENNFY